MHAGHSPASTVSEYILYLTSKSLAFLIMFTKKYGGKELHKPPCLA